MKLIFEESMFWSKKFEVNFELERDARAEKFQRRWNNNKDRETSKNVVIEAKTDVKDLQIEAKRNVKDVKQ